MNNSFPVKFLMNFLLLFSGTPIIAFGQSGYLSGGERIPSDGLYLPTDLLKVDNISGHYWNGPLVARFKVFVVWSNPSYSDVVYEEIAAPFAEGNFEDCLSAVTAINTPTSTATVSLIYVETGGPPGDDGDTWVILDTDVYSFTNEAGNGGGGGNGGGSGGGGPG